MALRDALDWAGAGVEEPAGNNGDPGTPHEFLSKAVDLAGVRRSQLEAAEGGAPAAVAKPWVLKLKMPDSVDHVAYRTFLGEVELERAHRQVGFPAVPQPAAAGVPRVIWMFWLQGAEHLSPQGALCVEGWRRLNPGWEVRLLDSESAAQWAPEATALWSKPPADEAAGGTGTYRRDFEESAALSPEGVLLQHRADLLRAALLRRWGGVWADASLLPLAPLDALLEEAMGTTGGAGIRDFFAFTFPDPALSWEVSQIPHMFTPPEPKSKSQP